jgi:hypothetical protein
MSVKVKDLNDDGTITCICGSPIAFLPPQLPDTPPRSVNHTGCAAATDDGETINELDPKLVRAFYKSHEPDPAAGAGRFRKKTG